MRLDINLIWAIVILVIAGIGGAYKLNEQKIEKLKLTHPKLAIVLETMGELAVKATTYQASIDGKEGNRKLADATDEVYDQMKKLYPNVPIDKDTARNYVQHMYDTKIKDTSTVSQVENPKKETIVEPIEVKNQN